MITKNNKLRNKMQTTDNKTSGMLASIETQFNNIRNKI